MLFRLMVVRVQRWRTPVCCGLCATAFGGAGGCVSGSLASNTGPRLYDSVWSDTPHQWVHVGERVSFDFVLQDWQRRLVPPLGLADYCVATIGHDRIDAEPDVTGHFQFTHTFDDVQPGQVIDVEVRAYRQRGSRDAMSVGGRWLRADNPYDQPDRKTARDAIRFTVYEARIELAIVRPPDDLDPETGVLRIRRTDGTATTVFIDRPGRPGFTMTGPGPGGLYRVRYRPTGRDLNPVGTTEVEFVVYDVAGAPHHATVTLETP